jgi:anti-sigma factor (TIGR02949 family)
LPANCAEVLSHLWEYLDDELAPELIAPIREHMTGCPGCLLAYSVDLALLKRVAALEVVTLTAPAPLLQRVEMLVRNA